MTTQAPSRPIPNTSKNLGSATLASAMAQRGLAYQQNKDYESALKDFNRIIGSYPQTPERELALQQKALILGQQKDYKGMTETFGTLLDAYPKSTGAGQRTLDRLGGLEEKDYKGAIERLEAARKLDPAIRRARGLAHCPLLLLPPRDRAPCGARSPKTGFDHSSEITRWLGRKSFEEGDFSAAEQYLLPVVRDSKDVDPAVLIELAEAQIRLGKFREACLTSQNTLNLPGNRSRGRGGCKPGPLSPSRKNYDEASKLCDESLLLQPGRQPQRGGDACSPVKSPLPEEITTGRRPLYDRRRPL